MQRFVLGLCLLTVFAAPAYAETTTQPPVATTIAIQPMMIPSSFADLASQVQDAVVNISTTQKVKQPKANRRVQIMPMQPFSQFPPGSPFHDFFEEFFNGMPQGQFNFQEEMPNRGSEQDGMAIPSVQSLGSGFIIDAKKGLIITNNHVISDADEIKVILHDDTQLDAKVLGRDEETDLTVLQVKTDKPLKQVSWGDSDAMRVGDWVLAVGNPFGLGGTVTSGIISARQRNINAGRYDDFIQTDASINRGNSGGPMFNLRGEVIGVNTAIFSPTGGSVGIGFAIPSNLAKPLITQLIEYGHTKRGWIGVKIQDLTPEIADSLGLSTAKGALVASVTAEGPAAKAGIKQGDIITHFNNKEVTEMQRLPRIVAESPINEKVPVTILRQNKAQNLSIKTGQLEEAKKAGLLDIDPSMEKADGKRSSNLIPELGFEVSDLNQEFAIFNF
jgi:serine protease Do